MRHFSSIEAMRVEIGSELGVSDWFLIDQARIDGFAAVTGDDYWIHTDIERATRELPDGRTIAHGYLALSLIPKLSHEIWQLDSLARGLNYGIERARFLVPIRVNDRIRLRQSLVSITPLSSGHKVQFHSVVELAGSERPACVADTISALFEG